MMSPVQVIATSSMMTTQRRENEDTQAQMANAIKAQAERIRQLELKLAQTSGELVAHKMAVTGLATQVRVMKGELKKVAPQHALFKEVGGRYPDGSARTALNKVYDDAFDSKAVELKLPLAGKAYREEAK